MHIPCLAAHLKKKSRIPLLSLYGKDTAQQLRSALPEMSPDLLQLKSHDILKSQFCPHVEERQQVGGMDFATKAVTGRQNVFVLPSLN